MFSLPVPSSASTKSVVLFPLTVFADQSKAYLNQGVKSMLISRISGGDIEIIPDEKYIPFLGNNMKQGITSKKRAGELARNCKADYAIFGSITTIGGGYSLDLSLLEVAKDKLKRISKAVDEDQLIPQLADVAYTLRALIQGKELPPSRKITEPAAVSPESRTAKGIFSTTTSDNQSTKDLEKGLLFKPTREYQEFKPTGKISVGISAMAFDMGDLDGKPGAELLVLERKKLHLYTRQGVSFVLKDTLKAGLGEDFLKVSIGDTDNNGTDKIFLVSRYGERARSTVLKWDGKFKRLDRRMGHMQIVRDPDSKKALLLFQDSKVDKLFSGRIYCIDYKNKEKFIIKEPLPELKGVHFYTLTLFDINTDGDPEWIGLGNESRLYVWNKEGAILWNGDKHLGGTNNAILLGNAPPGEPPPRITFNSRLLVTDIDDDGKREILAIQNIPLIKHVTNFKVYTKSNLIAYRLDGTRLTPAWTTREIDWCITDMQVDGQILFLAAQKGKLTNIGKGSSQIMWFE